MTIGGFISGTCLGWTSPTSNPLVEESQYTFTISKDDFSWIGSLMPVGALVACPLVGWLVDRIGRKNTILVLVFPAVVGWALMIWAESVSSGCICINCVDENKWWLYINHNILPIVFKPPG